MSKILKTTLGIFLCISIFVSLFMLNASAAGTIISFSKKSLTVGDKVIVTVTMDAGEAMYSAGCVINYNNDVINYTSGNASGGAGSVQIVESPSGETKVSYSLTFTAVAAGSTAVSVIDCKYDTLGSNGAVAKGLSGASATLTVNDATLSANANLSALSLSAGTLSPSFSASKTSYTVSVKNSVTECKVYATAADPDAKVEVSGESVLQIGKNTRTVTVTAPSGAQKVYTITINRSETEEVVSSEEPTSSETEEKPLDTSIEGITYTVATDISSVKLFKGFTASTTEYNSQQVAIAIDSEKNYKIYYLKAIDSEELVPYTFDEENQVFKKLNYFSQGENTYIYADIPEDKAVSNDYYTTSVTINGDNIKCYTSSSASLTDFYYMYCYADGRYGFYRYDSRENVMQRYPEFELVDAQDVNSNLEKDDTFINRFASLSNNAKTIIIALLLIIIFSIVLVVLLIVKFIGHRNQAIFEDDIFEDDSFDDVSFGNFALNIDTDDAEESDEADTNA